MQAYAAFLRQTPWYEYPFARRLVAFWRETPLWGPQQARKIERRGVVTLEYGTKAVYGAVIGWASATALGAADLEVSTVVVGLQPGDVAPGARITIVRELGGGRTLIRTPRYQAYTDLVVGLARRGRDVAEIAGNQRILISVLVPKGPLPALPGATPLFEAPLPVAPRPPPGRSRRHRPPARRHHPRSRERRRLGRAHLRLLMSTLSRRAS